ncbi:MAG TPA: right-handed parallel beta-helix repeat-containing protein [Blastocatellia bacterium]|nr:right-handed parallel beta-helix repeat-containing protein [Blastocatellia bacterium]
MTKKRLMLNMLAVFGVCLLCSSLAQAQATRTWVSGVGDDANPCSRTAPCKTFAGAISKTANKGEINCIDSAGFGAVTITKSITIDGAGVLAGILAAGTNGIIINAPAAEKVTIRNLSINGAGTGINGIRFLAGAQLSVENCVIFGFTTNGIEVNKSAGAIVSVKDTNITQCTTGVTALTTVGFVVGSLDNVRLEAMGNGLVAGQNAFMTVRNSSIFQNNTNGIQASANGSLVNVENCMVAQNGTGINASVSGATIRLSRSNILNNSTGINIAAGATVATFQNNVIFGNAAGVNPNSPQVQQ